MSTRLKAWRYREIVPRKVDSFFYRFIDPLDRPFQQKPHESALKTLLRKGIVVSNHGKVHLTPAGQFFLWRSRGSAKDWGSLTREEKENWRERLTKVALAEPRVRAPIALPKRGSRTRTYNQHVRLSLNELTRKINSDIQTLKEAIHNPANQRATPTLRSRILRKRNLRSIINAIIEELRYGEIDLTM